MKKYFIIFMSILLPVATMASSSWFVAKPDRHREILSPLFNFQNSSANGETQNQHNSYLRDIIQAWKKLPCQLKSRIHEIPTDGSASVEIVCISKKVMTTPSKDPYVIPYMKFWFEKDTSVDVRVGRRVIIEPISIRSFKRNPVWVDI